MRGVEARPEVGEPLAGFWFGVAGRLAGRKLCRVQTENKPEQCYFRQKQAFKNLNDFMSKSWLVF